MGVRSLAVVAGAGGFIGGHLVGRLLQDGWAVRAVDVKPLAAWQQRHPQAENTVDNLQLIDACRRAVRGAACVYNLAADMGGMEFIEQHRALCMLNVLINTHLLLASKDEGVGRYFFASSACVYSSTKQARSEAEPLREEDAYPASPEDGYGWEKLFGERMCRHFTEDFGLETRVGRYHNIYGPHSAFAGGREKAPAAICRKIARAMLDGSRTISIWGDGRQTRSFTYITDCIEGTRRLMDSEVGDPLNIGSSELVSIDQLVDVVEGIAGRSFTRRYDTTAPQGVRGRNSDNRRIASALGWAPSVSLRDGLSPTYAWVMAQMLAADRQLSG